MASNAIFNIWVQVEHMKEWVTLVLKRACTHERYNRITPSITSLNLGSPYLPDIANADLKIIFLEWKYPYPYVFYGQKVDFENFVQYWKVVEMTVWKASKFGGLFLKGLSWLLKFLLGLPIGLLTLSMEIPSTN